MIIRVSVKPNSKIEEIVRIAEGEYEIKVKEPPEGGKANRRLINMLSKELGVSYKKIRIKNPTARKKVIEVD